MDVHGASLCQAWNDAYVLVRDVLQIIFLYSFQVPVLDIKIVA